jgi:hypothetical protein
MSGDPHNPYASPTFTGPAHTDLREAVRTKVLAPAVALLGAALSLFNIAYAVAGPQDDPMAPEFVRQMQRGAKGAPAAIVQGAFLLLNLLLLVAAVQMSRFRNWGLALAASILAMLNFGSCCCVLGLPVGIWSLVVLCMPDVKAAFQAASTGYS